MSPISDAFLGRRAALTFVVLLIAAALPAAVDASSPDLHRVWVFVKGAGAAGVPSPATDRAIHRRAVRARAHATPTGLPHDLRTHLATAGIEPRFESDLIGAFSVDVSADQLAWLRTQEWVRTITPRQTFRRDPLPSFDLTARKTDMSDAGLSELHLRMIDALSTLERGIDGSGILIGFLDTQFDDFTHRVFADHRAEGRIVEERDFTGQTQANFHGLAVASVASGRDPGYLLGPAPGAALVGATTEYAPTETRDEEEFFVAGLEWLEALGVDVVNVSLGYTTFDDPAANYTPDDLDGRTAVTTVAVEAAAGRGVVVVVSAGNQGCASPANCWYYVSTPADAPSAVTVGAVRPDSTRAPFSSLGPTADGRIKPDVVAPGVESYVAIRGDMYARSAGTSFAAPLVSGIVAQMLQVNPDLTVEDVHRILRETAHMADRPDAERGHGVVSARRAVDAAIALREIPLQPEVVVSGAYPNPFGETLTLRIDVPTGGFSGRMLIVDALGREWARPISGTVGPGTHTLTIDTSTWPSGVYLYRLAGNGPASTGSLVRIR